MNILNYNWDTSIRLAINVSEGDEFNLVYLSSEYSTDLDTALGMHDMSNLIAGISGPISVHLTGSMSLNDLVAIAPFRKFGPFTAAPHATLYCSGAVSGITRSTIEEAELYDAYLQRRRATMLDILSSAYGIERGIFEDWVDHGNTLTYSDLIGSGLFEEQNDER